MKNISLIFGLVIFVAITVAIAAYAGMRTNRWGGYAGLEEARQQLKEIPLEIGDWLAADGESELDATSISMLEIKDSYIMRSYKNKLTQSVVYITIMLGPSGRVTVHTPEICFGGKDYEREGNRVSVPINVVLDNASKTLEDSFWKVDFAGKSLDTNNRISFYYAHSGGDTWIATESARRDFSRFRYAYKLQAQAYTPATTDSAGDTVKEFLTVVLPVIHEHLRPCK